jgi:Putative adhesin
MPVALLASLLLAAPFNQSWTFTPKGAPRVSVSNINGSITVEAGGSQVSVQAQGDEPDGFTAEAVEEGGEIRVAVCCGDSCLKGRGSHHDINCDGRIDLRLTVPAGTDLSVSNVSGPIRVSGVAGPQELSNVSGRIQSTGSEGDLHVSTVSGTVQLVPRVLGDVDLGSVSGNVELKLPRDASAKVRLSSLSGRITGDAGQGDSRRRQIGSGRSHVNAHSVSGDVTLTQ